MLTFLSPLFLAGAVAAAVPIVLHLLKREPEPRVKFAPVKLLKRAPVEHTQKHRLRELLLLALRVATLVFLALAFARPFFATGQAGGRAGVTVIALDTSYSMSAPGQFERARQLAKEAASRAAGNDRVGLVLFSDQGEIVVRPSTDRVLVSAAIDEATPGFGATRYRSALSAASQALSGLGVAGGHSSIVIVTDLQESGWDEGDRAAVPAGTQVEIADVGPPPPNVAVTSVTTGADRVLAAIRNAGPRARDVRVRLDVDGRAAGETTAALGPNQSGEVSFVAPRRGEVAKVSVDDAEGIAADNVRYALLTGSGRASVLVITGSGSLSSDGFYVQQALAAGGTGRRGYELASASGAQVSTEQMSTGGGLSAHSAVVLLSTRGLERRGREALAAYVRDGGGLFIAAGPDVDGAVAADVLDSATALTIAEPPGVRSEVRTVVPVDARHPILRPFSGGAATLALVRVQRAARIDGQGCQTLARFTTGDKALLECAAGEGRALVFASDLDNRWNDFPLHASFVPFLHESIRYLSDAHAHASEIVVGDAPAAVPHVPGVHTVAGRTPGSTRRVAVNVDPRETETGRLTADEFQSAVSHLESGESSAARVEARQQEDNQHLWQFVLALMVITLTVEGVIASRTA